MRRIAFLLLLFPFVLFAQQDCDVFSIQGLAAEVLTLQAEIEALSCYSGVEMDGYRYKGVSIGDQCWFAENLRTTVYADGSAIPKVTDSTAWAGLSTGARCVYDNDPVASYGYGLLYNWYAVDNASGLCPNGWHVPTEGDWTAFETHLANAGYGGAEGTALKASTGWIEGGSGSDVVGFSALPGGYRYYYVGSFSSTGSIGYWWSSSPYDGNAFSRNLFDDNPDIHWSFSNPRNGFSVRCLRDADDSSIQGCTDPAYVEYDAAANTDDGSCAILVVNGCTDPAYVAYDAAANTDDGSCATLVVNGCTDPAYVEYDAAANTDDGSCATLVVNGCTDPAYVEYDAAANAGDGSCATLVLNGCTDPAYVEYDAAANADDGSCATLIDPNCVDVAMEGHTYSVVQIGDQCWFAENLRTTVYADGTSIPEVTDDAAWTGLSTGMRCDYDNDATNVATYGRLYNWYAATDVAGLCPSGWHVPTDGEWTDLENYLGANGHSGTEGIALKATSGWSSGDNGTDDFGFSALPGGFRYDNDGSFNDAGFIGNWWSSSPYGGNAWSRLLADSNPDVYRFSDNPRFGYSVRCLRDTEVSSIQGCMDPAYVEYDAAANTDDGSCVTLIDPNCVDVAMDGHTYSVVQIGNQCWFAENLRTTVYADDSAIPEVTDNGAWTGLSTGARCDYENEAANVATYGRLYNWYAATDAAGLCPSGWHVPTDEEWTDLVTYITSKGFILTEGTALKSTSGWNDGGNGTDNFGFSALPGGFRRDVDGFFFYAGDGGIWWSSSPNGGNAWYRNLYSYSPFIYRDSNNPRDGFSVRCLRDAD